MAAADRPVIFVVPHPDDEVLGYGPILRRHVVAGRRTHLLVLTAGTATRVRGELNGTTTNTIWWKLPHDPAAEGYAPLSPEDVGAVRMAELATAAAIMGIGDDRIHLAGLQDGQVTASQAKAAIVQLADQLGPDTGLWTTSWLVDNHPDHRAVGGAVHALGGQQPTRFWDRRYVILSPYWNDPRIGQLPSPATFGAPVGDEGPRTVAAARCYGAWRPTAGAFAVGWHSVPSMFDKRIADLRVLVHTD